jgi:heptosyltransferase-2
LIELFLVPVAWFSKAKVNTGLDQVRKILVFEPGSLGDIVMLTPFLRSVRNAFPLARITILCRSGYGDPTKGYASISQASIETLLLRQGLADELIPLPIPWLVAVSPWKRYNPFSLRWPAFVRRLLRLRHRRFDLSFGGGRTDIRYNLVLWLTGAQRRIGYGFAGGASLLTDVAQPDMARPHQADLTLQLLEYLGVQNSRNCRNLTIFPEEEEFAARFLADHGVGAGDFLIGIHSGSRVQARSWDQERFQEVTRQLVDQHQAKMVWFTDPSDPRSFPAENVISASLPLRHFLAVLAKCHFLICNDSGPMHLAGAIGVPVVAIFGSTFPEWFKPPGDMNRIVTRRDIWCRPCGDRCIHPEPYCLKLIPVEQVMKEVVGMIGDIRRTPVTAELKLHGLG